MCHKAKLTYAVWFARKFIWCFFKQPPRPSHFLSASSEFLQKGRVLPIQNCVSMFSSKWLHRPGHPSFKKRIIMLWQVNVKIEFYHVYSKKIMTNGNHAVQKTQKDHMEVLSGVDDRGSLEAWLNKRYIHIKQCLPDKNLTAQHDASCYGCSELHCCRFSFCSSEPATLAAVRSATGLHLHAGAGKGRRSLEREKEVGEYGRRWKGNGSVSQQ